MTLTSLASGNFKVNGKWASILKKCIQKPTPINYNYTLLGQVLQHVDKAKYLDVTIQPDLKWHSHVKYYQKGKKVHRISKEILKHKLHLGKGTGI